TFIQYLKDYHLFSAVEKEKEEEEQKEEMMYDIRTHGTDFSIDSFNVEKRFASLSKTIKLNFPYRAVAPSTKEDYNCMIDGLRALIPNRKLRDIVSVIKKQLDKKTKTWVVVHCRMEQDWAKHAPQLLLSAEMFENEVCAFLI